MNMERVFIIKDKKTKEEHEVSRNIFMACFGEELPINNSYKLENDYCIGYVTRRCELENTKEMRRS